MRKSVWVSDPVRHKSDCTATENGQTLEILDLGSRGIVLNIYVYRENNGTDQLRS